MTVRKPRKATNEGASKVTRIKVENPPWVLELIDELRRSEENAWMGDMIECFSQGYTNLMVYKKIGRTHSAINTLRQESPGFAELLEMGEALSKAYWEEIGQTGVFDPKAVSFPMYAFYMKNKFGWSEKYETTDRSSPASMSVEQLKAEILTKLSQNQGKLFIGMDENNVLGMPA